MKFGWIQSRKSHDETEKGEANFGPTLPLQNPTPKRLRACKAVRIVLLAVTYRFRLAWTSLMIAANNEPLGNVQGV